jgi:CubicO group peptidase (beta-lactamase class C family)
MKARNIIWIFLTVIVILSGSHCKQNKGLSFEKRVNIGLPIPEGVMDTIREMYHVPGVSIAVIHNGNIDWIKGYGFRKYGSPERIDSTTLFQAASISKPVSAVLALQMVNKGLINLDENVNRKLKSWRIPDNEFTSTDSITLRRLLSHSAGLSMHGVPEFSANSEIPTLIQILDGNWYSSKDSVRPIMKPGVSFKYSGGGYIILQLLLTDMLKRPFSDLINEFVLQPSGMTSSTFEQPLPEELWSKAAVGHNTDGTPLEGLWHTLPEQAAGGLWTTPRDLSNFMIELWKSYQGQSDTLLPQNLAREMLTRQIDDFGLGIALPSAGVHRFQHSGGNAGYRCFMVLSINNPDGVVIMTNGDSGESLIWKVFELIAYAYGWSA